MRCIGQRAALTVIVMCDLLDAEGVQPLPTGQQAVVVM